LINFLNLPPGGVVVEEDGEEVREAGTDVNQSTLFQHRMKTL